MGDDLLGRAAASRAVRAVALAVGFGLHNAWVCAAMYSPEVLGASVRLPGVLGSSYSLLYLVSVVAFAVAAFVLARYDQALLCFARSRRAMLVAGAITCVGTLLAIIPCPSDALATTAETLAGVATGVGSAALAVWWGIAFSRGQERVTAVAVPVGVVLGFVINTLVIQAVPSLAGGLIAAVVPLAECLCLALVTPAPGAEPRMQFNALSSGKARFGLLILEMTALIGVALGVLKQAAVQTTFGGDAMPAVPVVLLTAGGMVVTLCVIYVLVRGGENWDPFFTAVCPAAGCAALLAAFFVADDGLLFDLFLLVAYFLYESLLWMYGGLLAHRLRLSPVFLFGLIRGMSAVAMFLGSLGASCVMPLVSAGSLDSRTFVFIPLVLMLLARAATPEEPQILRGVVRCPAVRLMAVEMDDRLALMASARGAEGDRAGVRQPVPAAVASPLVQESPAVGAPVDASGDAGGRFTRRVRKVAQIYLLIERETDILFDLAKGNTAAYIQDKHCISAGTVKTHVRNIYRKLDIHKRNDLMRLIDEIDDYE